MRKQKKDAMGKVCRKRAGRKERKTEKEDSKRWEGVRNL
jgi:hypothetical protein